MKTFDDLSDNEILALDDTMIERYIDYECAVQGIALPPPKPVPPELEKKPDPDVTLYSIGNFTMTDHDTALQVIGLLSATQLVDKDRIGDYNSKDYTYSPTSDYNRPKLDTVMVYSPEVAKQCSELIQSYNKKRSEYENKKSEYDSAIRGRKDITESIKKTIDEVKKKQGKKDFLRNEWKRYIDLAEGDKNIAYNFMVKVHKDLEEHDDLIEEFGLDMLRNNLE